MASGNYLVGLDVSPYTLEKFVEPQITAQNGTVRAARAFDGYPALVSVSGESLDDIMQRALISAGFIMDRELEKVRMIARLCVLPHHYPTVQYPLPLYKEIEVFDDDDQAIKSYDACLYVTLCKYNERMNKLARLSKHN